MANERMDVNNHQNTNEENRAVLQKLRARGKIDGRSSDELVKLFRKLNAKDVVNEAKIMKTQFGAQPNQRRVYGPIEGFPPGSWWGIRMDCSRDQVHCPFNENIQDGPFGAVSICTSHQNTHNDVDLGDFLTFTGREYDPETSSNDCMVRSYENRVPIRLVRSYNLSNDFAPKTGYRYDGLYIITSFWVGVSSDSKRFHKFALARIPHQQPPSWKNSSEPSVPILEKKTRTKTKTSKPRCHMACCKVPEEKSEKKVERIPSAIKSVAITKPEKSLNESTIVMRHVSKKCEPIATPGIEPPVQTTNRVLSYSTKSMACKLQNTNISIRTDLYNSSSNFEAKKSTPMTFCRIFKSTATPAKTSTPVETVNSNTIETEAKEKQKKPRESQIQLRSGIAKLIVDSPNPCLSDANLNDQSQVISKFCQEKSCPNRISTSEFLPESEESLNSKISSETLSENSAIHEDFSATSSRRSSDTSSIDSAIRKHKINKAVVSLESMTPEQMVNLILKKRYKKTGKILIGSIIGDPTFMNEINNTSSRSPSRSPTSNSVEKIKMKGPVKKKYFENKNPVKKIGNDNKQERIMKSVHLKRNRVSKVHAPTEDSSISKSRKETSSKRQKISGQNPFSKSTAMKKRRSELANLVIDANFTTKIRGPRTRSLRYPTRCFGKRRENLYLKPRQKKVDLSKKSKSLRTKKSTISQRISEPTKKTSAVESFKENVKRKSSSENSVTKKSERSKSRMVDAMIQCSLQKDASTLVDTETQSHYGGRDTTVKIEWVDLEDVKSETRDNGSDCDSPQEIVYRNSEVQTSAGESPDVIRRNCIRKNLPDPPKVRLNSESGLSAFAAVNLSDVDFRVARLRSIGFKPIDPCIFYANDNAEPFFENFMQSGSSNQQSNTLVSKRDVDEQYRKYTNAENDVVGYMDHELRYQDIEDEESQSNGTKMFAGMLRKRKAAAAEIKAQEKLMKTSRKPALRSNRKCSSSSIEEHEVPWNGWKKFVAKDGDFI